MKSPKRSIVKNGFFGYFIKQFSPRDCRQSEVPVGVWRKMCWSQSAWMILCRTQPAVTCLSLARVAKTTKMNSFQREYVFEAWCRGTQREYSSNHLNIALLNVFQYLNGRHRHIFIPQKFFICSDFLAESLVIRKLQGSKLTFSKISARKKAPENSR